MTTILDVAAKAGVGVGTVSRVINDSPMVSDATRAKVLEAIKELDYRPSSAARALSAGQTSAVCVLIPFLTRQSVFDRLRGIVDILSRTDFECVLVDIKACGDVRRYLDAIDRPSGILLITLGLPDDELEGLRQRGVPTVAVDVPIPGVPSVYVDDVEGGRMATRHLIELGHRQIAYVGDEETPDFRSVSSRHRHRGYEEVLGAHDIEPRSEYVRLGPHSRAQASWAVEELLDLEEPPTAVFAGTDHQALGVLDGAANRGVKVPEDISVVGFDDIDAAKYARLTTIRQPLYESGREAGEILRRYIQTAEPPVMRREMPLELIVRESTRELS